MAYIPHTEDERRTMLKAVGVRSLDDLFQAVPAGVRFPDLTCRRQFPNSR
jgi:glycine cleavage system pyridoxal-binding protein P